MGGRTLGIDLGERRIGLALSDPSGTLATPLDTLAPAGGLDGRVAAVAAVAGRLAQGEDGLAAIVVGWPQALPGGRPARRPPRPLAVGRLALRDKDGRRRRRRLDAAAAALILQEHLDAGQPARAAAAAAAGDG
ncbi:MAG: pre-16S rRNA-processing nuclease YqgF [Acidobacteria bacterium]|nr:pre-16S rRNA-processing nuclease YqgF [Acidobacteriota bacterium]